MQICDLLIKDSTVSIESDVISRHADITASNGRILEVGPDLGKMYRAAETLCGKGKLFMSRLINSHMHTGQQLLRGQVLDAKPIIWIRIMLPFENTPTSGKTRLSAQAAVFEMIKYGTAGFTDVGSYYMEDAADVYGRGRLKGALSYSTMDEEGLSGSIAMDADETVRHTDSLYDRFHGRDNLKVHYFLKALNSCSDRLVELEAAYVRERGTMLQAHMNEYMRGINGTMNREGIRPYEHLEKMQMLGPNFLGAHSLILPEQEKALVMERGVKTCHCPFSNRGKAVSDTPQLLEMGISVGLDMDDAAHGGLSLWNEMKVLRSIMNIYHGVLDGNPKVMLAETILKIVLKGGAVVLNGESSPGWLEPGYKVDIIGINLDQPYLILTGNVIHTLLECVNAGDVWDMIVNGRILMKDREVLFLDEERILYESRKYMKSLDVQNIMEITAGDLWRRQRREQGG